MAVYGETNGFGTDMAVFCEGGSKNMLVYQHISTRVSANPYIYSLFRRSIFHFNGAHHILFKAVKT